MHNCTYILLLESKPHFTTTLVVTSHVFAFQACLHATPVCVHPRPCDRLNTKDADTARSLLSCDVTTKMLVK